MSMQEALHCFSQARQPLHLSASIMGRNIAKREKKLSVVPTGHTVLQYVRPPIQARIVTTRKVTIAMIMVPVEAGATRVRSILP